MLSFVQNPAILRLACGLWERNLFSASPIAYIRCSLAYLAMFISLALLVSLEGSFGQIPNTSEATQVSKRYSQRDTDAARARDESFHEQAEIRGAQKCTSVRLQAVVADNDLNGVQLRHHSYNRSLVGPTIRVKPGTQLRIHLQNDLPEEPSSGATHSSNLPNGLNTTNIHTHGLHVSPKSPADDVFKEIAPAHSFDFVFDIHPTHPAGTFWYHPHKHGSTAFQLASGMSGALIVEGGLDDILQIKAAQEKIMVLQQFMFEETKSGVTQVTEDAVYNGSGTLVQAINGVVTPTIVMRPGEIQRWRIIHAGTTDAITLDLEGILFQEIAVDGLATGRMDEKKALLLYPGYRSDVLVQAPSAEGTRLLYTTIRDAKKSIRNQVMERSNLLRLVIEGSPLSMELPSTTQLAKVAAFKPGDVPQDGELNGSSRELVFNMGSNMGTAFYHVNDLPFENSRIDQELVVGTAEEWKLKAIRGIHPFHIHVNPFAVKPVKNGDPWVWRDTYVVSREQPVTIRTRYQDHEGDTVLHCHNLIHEDLGMMQRIKLKPSSTAPSNSEVSVHKGSQAAPSQWSALDRSGKRISSENYKGKFVLLVLHRGIECIHCAEQLGRLKRENDLLMRVGVSVVAISTKLPEGGQIDQFISDCPFPVLVDTSKDTFRRLDCLDLSGEPIHGLFLFDPQDKCLFSLRSETAVEDPTQWIFQKLQFTTQGEEK